MIRLEGGAHTSPGQVRSENQDRPVLTAWIAGVADGMGGHRGGETAAQLAVGELAMLDGPLTVDGLVAAVQAANDRILSQADDPSLRGMGTTLVAMTVVDDDVVVVNVGDSRGYRLVEGGLEQLTEDHSLVEDLVRQGRLSAEEAKNHPQRNIVTRALGIGGQVQVDVFRTAAHPGDRYLLCSDGLFNEIEADQIALELGRWSDPREAARELVRLANAAGARDNVTCVVVDLRADDDTMAAAAAVDRSVRPETFPGPAPAGVAGRESSERSASSRPEPRGRAVPWAVVPYVLGVLAIAGVAIGGTIWWGRAAYFVGAEDGEVVIFRGRPGGVLWMDPTIVQHTDIEYDDLTGASKERLVDPPVGSRDQAEQVLEALRIDEAPADPIEGVTSSAPPAARPSRPRSPAAAAVPPGATTSAPATTPTPTPDPATEG